MTDRPSRTPLAAGSKFGSFEVVRVLGAGAMGVVYEALHPALKKRVAIKTLHADLVDNEEIRVRFLREAEAAARIQHPNVVDVVDVGTQDATPYIVMEFLEGETLKAFFAREAPLDPARIANVMLPVISAVALAHTSGVIHRDLKPENIQLTKTARGVEPKVLDFGISRIVDSDQLSGLTNTAAMLGTPYYMSPEQARSPKGIDGRSDQFSIGVMLYEAATKKRPFSGSTVYELLLNIGEAPIVPPTQHRPDIPVAFEQLILRALERPREKRFESVNALGRALYAFADDDTRAIWRHAFGRKGEDTGANVAQGAHEASVAPSSSGVRETGPTAAPVPATSDLGAASKVSIDAPAAVATPGAGVSTLAGSAMGVSIARDAKATTRRGGVAIGLVGVAIAIAASAWALTHRGDSPRATVAATRAVTAIAPHATPSTIHLHVEVAPPDAQLLLDDELPTIGPLDRDLRDDTMHTLRVSHDGFESQTFSFRDQPPPTHVALVAIVVPPAPVRALATDAGVVPSRPASAARRASTPSHGHAVGATPSHSPNGEIEHGDNNATIY